jgi:hypothetical protein
MTIEVRDVPPGHPDTWRVTGVGRRVRWTDESRTCAACGATVELDRRHYYVAMSDGPAGRGRRTADEERVFCGARCLDRWS